MTRDELERCATFLDQGLDLDKLEPIEVPPDEEVG
jgi:hypothetical protein